MKDRLRRKPKRVQGCKTIEEVCALVEAGYEYVTEFKRAEIKIFRKRK